MKTYTIRTAIYVTVEATADSAQAAIDLVYGNLLSVLDELDLDYDLDDLPSVEDEQGREIDPELEEV